jgi:GrpB-like predicted nucleotidyltransferase (UPF0157 family)
MKQVVVMDYSTKWPLFFQEIQSGLWKEICQEAKSIEHVGSTSVPGLAAKPVIDMTIVVENEQKRSIVIKKLETMHYKHLGDLGISGREAFRCLTEKPAHNLYLCIDGNIHLQNHLLLRDYLRKHPSVAQEYGALKKRLAHKYPQDIDAYTCAKTDFILKILDLCDFAKEELAKIRASNQLK